MICGTAGYVDYTNYPVILADKAGVDGDWCVEDKNCFNGGAELKCISSRCTVQAKTADINCKVDTTFENRLCPVNTYCDSTSKCLPTVAKDGDCSAKGQ
jgi:hypothetical protein